MNQKRIRFTHEVVLSRRLAGTFVLVFLIITSSLSFAQSSLSTSSFGVWDRGDTFDPKDYPFLKGLSFGARWADVERQPGVFDWSQLDNAIEKAFQRKMYIYLSLGVGPEAPDWIYSHGVPAVKTDDTMEKHLKWKHYPYYLSTEYKFYFQRLIIEFGKHIRGYSKDRQERIAFVQVKTGSTGDETPYKGKALDKKYDLTRSSAAWREFRLWAFDIFNKTFQATENHPQINLLFNAIGSEIGVSEDSIEEGEGFAKEWDWVIKNVKGSFGIKNGALSRGHHLDGERSLFYQWTPYLINPKGLTLFRRSEMDQTWTKPWYQLNVPLNFYWGVVNALNGGQSIFDISKGAIEASQEQGFDYSFYFFNKYAGQIYPEKATDAFCSLHKGLDAADTMAYPEAVFGPARRGNVDRMLKICASFSKYGAAVDDQYALTLNQVRQRDTQKGFNDVGWDIWPDNYSRFLYQIDADKTSIPLWRIGGQITKNSSIYSRFARSFENATGKDAMYFKLDDSFFVKDKLEAKTITLHVIYYDNIKNSSWKIDYDAGNKVMKTACSVKGIGDKKWKDTTIVIKDAVLNHGGTRGCDIALVNTDKKDDIFSLIEVHRGVSQSELMYSKAPAQSSDTNVSSSSDKVKTKKDKKTRKDKKRE
jgi:hypothetical protein